MKRYKLLKPLLGFASGEHLTYERKWGGWTRQKTGETFDHRGSIGEGEIAMLLDRAATLPSIMQPPTTPSNQVKEAGRE